MIKRLIANWRRRKSVPTALTGVVQPSPAIEKVVRDLNELARKNGWALSDTIETTGDCACGDKKPAAKKPAAKKPAAKRTDATATPAKKPAARKKKS